MEELRPNKAEILFLTYSYNRFYDLFDEIFSDSFWELGAYFRLAKFKDVYSIYSELLSYEPIQWEIDELKKKRPPMEAEIGKDLFKFIRNLISHFPLFESWDEIWLNQPIINWAKSGQTIDRFLEKNLNTGTIKYRFWEENRKKMTYLSINYPTEYGDDKIYLKDIVTEKEGVKFSLILMKKIIDSQVIQEAENV